MTRREREQKGEDNKWDGKYIPSNIIYIYISWNIAQTSGPNERVLWYHAACKAEFQPPIGRTHS